MQLKKRDLDRIAAQESARLQIRRELDPPKSEFWLWPILRGLITPFVTLVVFSILLGWINSCYHEKEAALEQQREDSQFFASLMPQLTSPDVTIRLLAGQVILTRYPPNNIPPHVARLVDYIQNNVKEAIALPSFQKRDDQKLAVANTVGHLDKIFAANPTLSPTLPRIDIGISNEKQRPAAQALVTNTFHQQGFLIGKIDVLKDKPPAGNDARVYAYQGDKALADRVAGLLDKNGFSASVSETVATGPGTVQVQLGTIPQSKSPAIISVPTTLTDGEIRGFNFGIRRGFVFVHPQVKRSRADLWIEGANSGFTATRLLGSLDATNKFELPDKTISSWTDDKIVLKFDKGYAKNITDLAISRAAELKVDLKESDIEFQYRVQTANEETSEWFPR